VGKCEPTDLLLMRSVSLGLKAGASTAGSLCEPGVQELSRKSGRHFENARREWHDWELLSLGCRGRLLVLREDVGLMTADTSLAFHEWIGLQLGDLIGVTGVAGA